MASDTAMAKAYEQLTGVERFRLMIEAMARGDEREAERLEDTCPQHFYRADDADFRDRMRRIHVYALHHALQVAVPQSQLRVVRAFADAAALFSKPIEGLAEVAFFYGREYGKWEVGAIAAIELPDEKALKKQVADDAFLREQLGELREGVREALVASARLQAEAAEARLAPEVAVEQLGFARFCERSLGLDAAVVLGALVGNLDEPKANEADEAAVEAKAGEWVERWRRRFPP